MIGRVRVLLWHRTADSTEPIEAAYHAISTELAGTPGLLGNELLRSPADPRSLVVASEWADLASFQTWERGSSHKASTSPLRPYRDLDRVPPYEILEVVAEH